MQITRLRMAGYLAVAQLVAATAYADIDLRVQAWPGTVPVDVFARVSVGGESTAGLTADDFAVTLDGQALDDFAFGLPPSQDAAQRISVVLVVTDPTGLDAFLSQLAIGDYVSIVTFRDDAWARFAPIDVQPFTQIDGGTGTNVLNEFLDNVYRRDSYDMRPAIRNLSGALQLANDQFAAPALTLPDGPKAIVLVKASPPYSLPQQSDVVASANSIGMPIFTIYTDHDSPLEAARLKSLADTTGGVSFPVIDESQTSQAFVALRKLLNDAYRLRIPALTGADCNPRVMEVTAQGETQAIAFTPCDTTPDDLHFEAKSEVPLSTLVASDPVTVTGIDTAVAVNVFDGEFSIGCGPTFTSEPGLVLPDEQICVRHVSGQFHNEPVYTSIVVGGVAASFESTAVSPPPPPPTSPPPPSVGEASGGGGAASVLELLFALSLLVAGQRCRTYSPGASASGA